MSSSKVLEIIVKAKDQASKSFDEISKNSKKLEDSLKNVKKYSWIATTALAWLGAIMVKQAMDIEPVRKSFDQLSQSIGESSDTMLKSLKEASKGAVSEYDLMLASNKAMKLWVAQNTEDMTQLMKIARLYWQQMWQDVTKSFDDIVTWLWRWSAMILDNLWIVVNQTEAQEKYAQSLWKTVDQLTDAEKKQALVNATLEEWQKALDKFGEPAQTMQERMSELKNSFTEMWTRIWTAMLPVLEKLLEKIQPVVDKIVERVEANPELASNILIAVTAISWLVFVLSSVAPAVSTVISIFTTMWSFITSTLIPAIWWLSTALGAVWLTLAVWWLREWLSWLEEKIISTDEQIAIYQEAISALDIQLQNWTITQEQYNEKVAEYQWLIAEADARSRTFSWYLKDEFNETLQMMTFKNGKFNEWRQATVTLMKMLREWLKNVADRITNVFVKAIDQAIDRLRELRRRAQKVGADIWSTVSNAWSATKNRVADKISWFANGWHVAWNVPILVGEKWPELFVPQTSWNIIPNDEMWWNNVVVNVNFGGVAINNWMDASDLASTITDVITRNLELYQKGIY